ncbi:MAG: aminopeptidase [Bacteroides sp.]|nr:aminopeptidase [Bacteroides sp.]
MKNTLALFRQPFLLVVWIACSLPLWGQEPASLPEILQKMLLVKEVTSLESDRFSRKYLLRIEQPLDHADPAGPRFTQRVVLCHTGFDKPVVLVTEGYSGEYALRASYRDELSRLLDANILFAEHRYFGESRPDTLLWEYLTAENAAYDIHRITHLFKPFYPGKWIATGISKGGQTALIYRTFFPDDVAVTLPYVAPLCRAVEDERHEKFLRHVGTRRERRRIEHYQKEVLRRREEIQPLFDAWCNQRGYTFRIPLQEVYDYCLLEYPFAFWQWGKNVADIPPPGSEVGRLFAHLMDVSEPSYFAREQAHLPFFVQAARELGYYGYDTHPFRPYLTIESAHGYLHRVMLPRELENLPFDDTLYHQVTEFLDKNDLPILFIYGQHDPWTAAGVTGLKGKKQIKVYTEPGGSHLARISSFPEQTRVEILKILEKWLEEE